MKHLKATSMLLGIVFSLGAGLAGLSSPASAHEASGALLAGMGGGKIPGLKIAVNRLRILERRARTGMRERVFELRGVFHEQDSHLVINERLVSQKNDGEFEVAIPVHGDRAELIVREVDFLGNVSEARGVLIAASAQKDARELADAKSASIALPQKQSKGEALPPKRASFSLGLGVTSFTYQEVGGVDFSEKAVTLGFGYEHPVARTRWGLGVAGDFTALPFGESSTSSGKQVGSNALRVLNLEGYASAPLTRPHSKWQLSLHGGVYSSNSFVSGDIFGFKSMFGPELYPVLSRTLSGERAISAYVKYSPVIQSGSGLNFTSNALDAGASYSTGPHPGSWNFGLDYQKLQISVDQTSVQYGALTIFAGVSF